MSKQKQSKAQKKTFILFHFPLLYSLKKPQYQYKKCQKTKNIGLQNKMHDVYFKAYQMCQRQNFRFLCPNTCRQWCTRTIHQMPTQYTTPSCSWNPVYCCFVGVLENRVPPDDNLYVAVVCKQKEDNLSNSLTTFCWICGRTCQELCFYCN